MVGRTNWNIGLALAIGGFVSLAGLSRIASADFLDPTAFASLGAFPIAPGAYSVVEGTSASGAYVDLTGPGGFFLAGTFSGGLAVFDFDSINLTANQSLTAVPGGPNLPIAFLSRGDATIAGTVNFQASTMPNVSLYTGFAGGLGGGSGGASTFGGSGAGGGSSGIPLGAQGGGGGGFGAPGGAGGAAGGLSGAAGGGANGDLTVALQGGGGGGAGSSSMIGAGGKGGGGGGAIEIGALGVISVSGSIDVSGSAGGPGLGTGLSVASSGGGGGSGGGILLHGQSVVVTGSLIADGGVGGAGGSSPNDGSGGGGGGGGRIVIGYYPGTLDLANALILLTGGSGGLTGGGVNASAGASGFTGTLNTYAVPEPGSITLLSLGLASLGLLVKRSRH